MVVLLLGSGPLAFESALLCTFRHFSLLSAAFGTLKVIEAFPDAEAHMLEIPIDAGSNASAVASCVLLTSENFQK